MIILLGIAGVVLFLAWALCRISAQSDDAMGQR